MGETNTIILRVSQWLLWFHNRTLHPLRHCICNTQRERRVGAKKLDQIDPIQRLICSIRIDWATTKTGLWLISLLETAAWSAFSHQEACSKKHGSDRSQENAQRTDVSDQWSFALLIPHWVSHQLFGYSYYSDELYRCHLIGWFWVFCSSVHLSKLLIASKTETDEPLINPIWWRSVGSKFVVHRIRY